MNFRRRRHAQVGLLAELALQPDGIRLAVGTTHLYWDPALEDVKNAQAAHFLAQTALFLQRCATRRAAALPGAPAYARAAICASACACSMCCARMAARPRVCACTRLCST